MSSTVVLRTNISGTSFVLDVFDLELSTSLSTLDFEVTHNGTIINSYTKTSPTQLSYAGANVVLGTRVSARRVTSVVQSETTFISTTTASALTNALEKLRLRVDEIDGRASYTVNQVALGGVTLGAIPVNNGIYPTGWSGDTTNAPSRNTVFNSLAPLASPAFTGNPTAVTQTLGDNSTRLATTAFVQQENATEVGGFKNLMINGRFNVSQRGLSLTIPAGATFPLTYLMDNWRIGGNGGGGTIAAQSLVRSTHLLGQTSVPNSPTSFLTLTNSTQGTSLGVSSFNFILTYVEDVTQFSNRPVTLSFWARSTVASKIIAVEAVQNFGTGGSPSADVNTLVQRVTLTTSWARYTFTFTPPTLTGQTLGTNANTSSLTLVFWLQGGSTFNSRIGGSPIAWQGNGDFSLSDVQLEFGSLATTIEQRPVAADLALCQRYYESGTAYLRAYSLANGETSTGAFYKATKRIVPTVAVFATGQVGMAGTPAAFSLGFHSHEIRWNKDASANMFAWLSDFTADASF